MFIQNFFHIVPKHWLWNKITIIKIKIITIIIINKKTPKHAKLLSECIYMQFYKTSR